MGLPNLRAIREQKAIYNGTTLICVCCKAPLWHVKVKGQYGTRFVTEETPYPGVPDYADYWSKKHHGYARTDCPFCGEQFFDLIMNEHGEKVAKPRTLELG